jgi:uncharacterized protein (UPF0548 family)
VSLVRDSCSSTKRSSVNRYSEITYSTLEGHLIEGEERYRVVFTKNAYTSACDGRQYGPGEVVFEMFSFTKGAHGALGYVTMPIIKPLQDKFFRDLATSFRQLMATKTPQI